VTEQYLQPSINMLSAPCRFSGGIGAADVLIPGAVVTPLPLSVVEGECSLIRHVLGSSELEFLASGSVLVEWDVSIDVDSGGRKNSQTTLFLDEGFGFLPVNLTFGYGYHRNTAQGKDSTSGTKPFRVSEGDKIEIASQRIAGTGNLKFIASSNSVKVSFRPDGL